MEQRELPFDRRAKFDLLRRAKFPAPPGVKTRDGQWRGPRLRNLLLLIEKIETTVTPYSAAVKVPNLAGKMNCAQNTVRQAIRDAEAIGVLVIEHSYNGDHLGYRYHIQWDRIGELAQPFRSRRPGPFNSRMATPSEVEGVGAKPEGVVSIDPRARVSSLDSSFPPPPWPEVETALINAGVGRARAAVRAAQANGATSSVVMAIVEYYRANAGAWGPGALYQRVLECIAGDDPGANWMPVLEGFRRQQSRATADRADRERRRRDAEESAKRAASKAAAENRKRVYGPQVNEMGDDDARRLFAECFPTDTGGFVWKRFRAGDDAVLDALYQQLERRTMAVAAE